MKSSNVIPADAQGQFWYVVRRCIREFHAEVAQPTLRKASLFRKKVEQLPINEMELFFHSEPFDVACNLAGRSLRVENHLKRYLEIRDEEGNQDS